MKKRRIYNVVIDVTLLLLVLVVAFYLTFDFINPSLTVKYLGVKPYVVLSDSMEPAINVGDVVVIKKHKIDKLDVGDVIAFTPRRGVYVAHYLAEINKVGEEYQLRTRPYGREDKSQWDYQTLKEDNYLGKCVLVIPFLGRVFLFIKSPIGMATVIVSVVLIYLIVRLTRRQNVKKI